MSLLDAALHNFADNETFEPDSDFIVMTDEDRELFDTSPVNKRITISQYLTLCRELDIGAQYKAHLETLLLDPDPVARAYLQTQVRRNQKAAFKAAAHMAYMKQDIGADAYALVIDLLGKPSTLTLNGQVMQVCELGMMDLTLTGILLIVPHPGHPLHSETVIAYVPHDPEHPVKQYGSSIEFMVELTRQLRANEVLPSQDITYQQFFSQFVDHEQRGHFFADLNQRLTYVKWYAKEPLDDRPSWRETPVDKPNLQFSAWPITGNLLTHVFQRQLNKILNDARTLAVPTADADSNARWAWWENFKKIVSDIFNVAVMVLAPFVPGLGELMMAYTAYQLANDVIEGIVDLAEGHWREGVEHIVGVVSDVTQLIAYGVGAEIAGGFSLKISGFIEGMKPVRLPNGESRLWHPDITPYARENLALPQDSKPDELGLHRHEGKLILPLENRHYEVRHVEGQPRLQHPERPDAYAPKLAHNGRAAWAHEGENPLSWDSSTLMRRLGHSTDGFTPRQLEIIREISATEDDSLRRTHAEHAPPPLLLEDTLKRVRSFDEVDTAGLQIRHGKPIDPSSYWFQQLVTDLPGWPSDCALKVYERADLSGAARTYGSASATPRQTLSVGLPEVMKGRLPEQVTAFLNESQMETLLGAKLPKDHQVQALRDRLADQVEARKPAIADYVYRQGEYSRDPRVRHLQQRYPQLPTSIAERLLAHSGKRQLDTLANLEEIPLSIKGPARECAFESMTTRAFEGFYHGDRMAPDTERLALNVLRLNSDTFSELRIEIRHGTYDGELRASVGSNEATNVRMLLRDESGRYEVRDTAHRKLFDAQDLYESILCSIPERTRQELALAPGQGRAFRQWLMTRARTPAERRSALVEPSIRPVADLQTSLLVRGPVLSKPPRTLEQSVQALYPEFSEREVDTFLRSVPSGADPAAVVRALETELQALRNTLDAWQEQNSPFEPDQPAIAPEGVRFIADRLIDCFQRKPRVFDERSTRLEQGYTLDLSKEVYGFSLERWWRKLPDLRSWFDQVTTMNLDGMRFAEGSNGLLKDFSGLRHLSARNAHLTRLPESVGKMHWLETLCLDDNRIALSDSAVSQLRDLTRLQTLRLSRNPLGNVPNVERMPRLKVLTLADTGIERWPDGLLRKHRPRGFFLDLQNNPIRTVPEVIAGSREALIVARTRLSADRLLDSQRNTLFDYRQSVGLPRENVYAPLAADARRKWPMNDDSSLWGSSSAGLSAFREEAWDNLMNEPNSEGFFKVIDSLTTSADFRAGGRVRDQLSRRVWELIDAMDLDTPLREALFRTAENPDTCEDGTSEIFNRMGVQALVSRAYAYTTSAAEREIRLVRLGKGAARLDEVNAIARADMLSRPSREEEVEVYMAYQTGLAQRLDLPWQSDGMKYRQIAGVSDAAIDQAYTTVLEREQGDGLVNSMLDQPFWERYLYESFPEQLQANDQSFDQQSDQLSEMTVDPETGAPMTEQRYSQKISDLAYARQALARNLTRDLLKKHNLE